MVTELGRLGQKVGKGFYDYDLAIGKGWMGFPSKEMEELIKQYLVVSSENRRQISINEII
jgi:3-hydroxyacyl-CoA dehydrogenase